MSYFEPGNFELLEFSIVDRCPYCDARFNEKGTTRDGKECAHPTRVTFTKPAEALAVVTVSIDDLTEE